MHYSIVIYIYIFIYIFSPKKKKKKKKLPSPMNEDYPQHTGTADVPVGGGSAALRHASRGQRGDRTFCWSRSAVVGDTCGNPNTGNT